MTNNTKVERSSNPTLTKLVLVLLFANLLFLAALLFRRNTTTSTTSKQNIIIEPSFYYYSLFTNSESQRTLYHETLQFADGNTVGTVGASGDISASLEHDREWTKESVQCPEQLHSSIPHHFSECFLLINIASGARLYDFEWNDPEVGSVHSNTPNEDNQIWLNEYPLHMQGEEPAVDLVTIRNVASGRRLFATEGDDLSVGFGASSPASDEMPASNELWEERVQYKYANVLTQAP